MTEIEYIGGSLLLRSIHSFNISVRSSMATSGRSILPEHVAAALALRSSDTLVCPVDVEKAISSHVFFKNRVVAVPPPRFGRLPAAT